MRTLIAGLLLILPGCATVAPPVAGIPERATEAHVGTTVFPADSVTAVVLERLRNEPGLVLFLRDMPKGGDLHSHLSGVVYAETYIEWAAEDGMCADTAARSFTRPPCTGATQVPGTLVRDNSAIRNMMIDALSVRNWDPARNSGHSQFFDTFGRFNAVSGSGRTGDMLAEATTRAAAGNVSYLELMLTTDVGVSSRVAQQVGWDRDLMRLRERMLAAGLKDAISTSRQLLDAAEARRAQVQGCGTAAAFPGCDVTVRYLYQVARARAPEYVFAQILTGFEVAAAEDRVVGLNLVQPEDHPVAMRDYALHMRMIGMLRPLYPDVRVTLHAGELAPGLVPPEGMRFHIRDAVRVAGASRIGHGVAIAHEDSAVSLLQQMAREGVLVEINLSSNHSILGVDGAEHPLKLYMRYGVPVTLSTDDEGVLRSEMTMEYVRAVRDQGLTYPELKRMARASLEHAFVDEATRRRLLEQHDRAVNAFEARWFAR